MSLQIADAVVGGVDRVLTRTGAILFGPLLVLTLLNTALWNTALSSTRPSDSATVSTVLSAEAAPLVRPTLPIPEAVAGLLVGVVTLFLLILVVIMARAFARPTAELSTFPVELYTRRIGWAILSTVVASSIIFVSVGIGFALLILPGVFLGLSFLFFQFAIGVEDRGVVGSLRRSWELSQGNQLKLLVVLAVVAGIGVVNPIVSGAFGVVGLPAVGTLTAVVLSTVMGLLYNAVLAASYLQLADTGTQQF